MEAFFAILMAVVSILAHEWAHVITVRFFGGKVDKVGFFPLGMVAKAHGLELLPPRERYIIYAAGPALNLFIAAWAFLTSYLSFVGVPWLNQLALINLALAVFNLLPALPLDGGQIFLLFWGNTIGGKRACRLALRLSRCIGVALILLGLVQLILYPFNITLFCAGEFIRRKSKTIAPELHVQFYRALDGKNSPQRARFIRTKRKKLPEKANLKQALDRLQFDHRIEFCMKKEYLLTEKALLDYIFIHGLHGNAVDAAVFVLPSTCGKAQ